MNFFTELFFPRILSHFHGMVPRYIDLKKVPLKIGTAQKTGTNNFLIWTKKVLSSWAENAIQKLSAMPMVLILCLLYLVRKAQCLELTKSLTHFSVTGLYLILTLHY